MILFLVAWSLVSASRADEVPQYYPPYSPPYAGDSNSRPPDYKIVESADEIAGEPMPGREDSYASWKIACDRWKKELKENNPGRLLSANCGRPRMESDSVTFKKTQISNGTYKIKVALHDPIDRPAAVEPAPAPVPSGVPSVIPSGVAAATGAAGK